MDLWTWLRIFGLLLVAVRGWDFAVGAFKIWNDPEPRKWTRFGDWGRGHGTFRKTVSKFLDFLWFFPCFCVWMSAFACLDAARNETSNDASDLVLYGLVVGLVAVNILVYTEACLSFIRLGRWGSAYHGLPIGGEFPAAVGAGLTTLISSVSLYFVVASAEPSLLSDKPLTSRLDVLGLSLFQAVMTLTQASPPQVASPAARVAVAVVTLTGLAFLAVLVALVAGAVGVRPSVHTARREPRDAASRIESDSHGDVPSATGVQTARKEPSNAASPIESDSHEDVPTATGRVVIGVAAASVAFYIVLKRLGKQRHVR